MGEEKNSIVNKIPEEIKLYNTLYLKYREYGKEARNTFNKILGEYKGLDDLVSDGFDTSLDIIKTYIDYAVDTLKDMDVENITEENFTQKYYQKYCTFGDVFNNLENQYKKIEKSNHDKILKEKTEIFKSEEVRENILNSIENSVVDIHEAILDCVENETDNDLYRVTSDDKKEAQDLLFKLKSESKLLRNDEKLNILEKMLGSNPYLEETYFYLLDINRGDKNNQIEQYANYFGIDLAKRKSEIINSEINKYLKGNLDNVGLKDKKEILNSYFENYFSQKYKQKDTYSNKVYLDNLNKIYKDTFKTPKLNEDVNELIDECNFIYEKYNDERFLNIKNEIEKSLLNSKIISNLKKESDNEIKIEIKEEEAEIEKEAQREYKLESEREEPKHDDQRDEKHDQKHDKHNQEHHNQHDIKIKSENLPQIKNKQPKQKNQLTYDEYAVAAEPTQKKSTLSYGFKIASLIFMLFSGVMLFDLFIQILDNRFIYGRDLLLSYVTVGVLFGLSLVCNYAAIKKTHPYGKIVSNKSILIRVFIAIISFIGGTISDKTYIEAFCFTIGIMVFLYIIRDCLFRRGE